MSHSFSLISTLAIGFAIAWALGFLMERIKVPALVGYLLAGIIISPATPGFVGDVNIASELSEIGVMLLMFGVGLHFSMSDLIRVKNIAVPGAILQMGLATCLGAVLAHFWGWPWGQALSSACVSRALPRLCFLKDWKAAVFWRVATAKLRSVGCCGRHHDGFNPGASASAGFSSGFSAAKHRGFFAALADYRHHAGSSIRLHHPDAGGREKIAPLASSPGC